MNHREELEEVETKATQPQSIRHPNGSPVEGGHPRWRPCQLNSKDYKGNPHHHHHHHHRHYRQSHQEQPGSNRVLPRESQKPAPCPTPRGSNESGDADPQLCQQQRSSRLRYRQSGDGGHQHRHQLQPRQIHAAPQAFDAPESSSSMDILSPEESSQELMTPSSQDDLNPSQEEPNPSPQKVPSVEAQARSSPGLHCSSSTESNLHAHSEQTEHQNREREQMEECKCGIDQWKEEGCLEQKEEGTEPHREAEHEEQNHMQKNSMANDDKFRGSRKTSRRSGPIRVDVPPFAEFPHQQITVQNFQSQPFSEPLRGYPMEPISGSMFSSTAASTDMSPEFRNAAQSYEETFSDSSSETCSTSYPSVPESCPKIYPVTPTKSDRELYHSPQTGWYQEPSKEQWDFENKHDMSLSEDIPQNSLHEEQKAQGSVGSRLHHYDEQSGDECSTSDRGTTNVWRHRVENKCSEIRKEQCELHHGLPVMDREEKSAHNSGEDRTYTIQESADISGNAISLAIRDIREAIEEVKTKTVRSPYTPDKPKEPVWVMRRDISPMEECGPNLYSPPSPPQLPFLQNTTCSQVLASNDKVPLGAEVSGTHELQEGDISPSLPTAEELRRNLAAFPTYIDVPGPCDPDDLIDGIIFAASFLGSTQLLSERTPSKCARMQQAQEAMSRVRAAGAELHNTTEVDLFVSTQRIKVLSADTQDTIMDHPLRTISYIADIGNMVVLMARRKMIRSHSVQEQLETADAQHSNPAQDGQHQYRMICHVFESEDAQLIAQSIGQSFSVAYQEFLRANGIDPDDLSQREYSDLLNTQDMYNDDLVHFSKSENCRDVYIEKQKGEILGVVIVESGWGSILPTVIIASLMHSGPAAKSGRLNIGDQIMTVNGTSLVGLPLSTCQSIIKGLKSQSRIKMNIVRCPPVTMVLIRRPDLRYQLGFSVQNGIICSLMRGGIAERGGVRVGHRIIEINGHSVVATPHEKIVHILSSAVGEIHMKTMPAAMYRLLTAQEQPVYI
ncbi:amyloid-beta A4 precursor protein-binding family A member 1 [Silurus meridionalis]|uniref:Amyloid-beta A4 precursor protein-binding family A member 3 n=1 Tax=Silurus meridionalis TaxID=175797 RepID=A0A8T0B7J9_SILME|nr:amyloid-beta A4 precursor protein-binding family A member 1 [Silurus meridionalis]KAF7700736.1 hypothetical protein HF521_001901 [Silurus meridionalis]